MSGVFRDPTDGAKAKRLVLLRQRRDEFIDMPHTVRRVIVSRSARIAACLVICLAGAVLLAATASPELAEWLGLIMPGRAPAVLSTLLLVTWGVGVAVHMIARSVAEHRFAVTMSRYVLPSEDLDSDIERLAHERPEHAARHMARRLEVRSAVLSIAAAAVLWPATLLYLLQAAAARGYPSPDAFEATLLAQSTGLAGTALLGLVVAVVTIRRVMRTGRAAAVASFLAAVPGTIGLGLLLEGESESAWLALGPAVIATAVALLGWRLRAERALLQVDDPAAGAETFSLRRAIGRTRDALAAARAALTWHNARRALAWTRRAVVRRPSPRAALAAVALVALVAGALYGASMLAGTAEVSASDSAGPNVPDEPIVATDAYAQRATDRYPRRRAAVRDARSPRFQTVRSYDGKLVVTATFDDKTPLEIPSLLQLDELPAGWQASIQVSLDHVSGQGPVLPVLVTPLAGDGSVYPRQLGESLDTVEFWAENCDGGAHPLTLRIEPYGKGWRNGPHRVRLSILPSLALAVCE